MRDMTDLAEIRDYLVLRFRLYSATTWLPEQKHAEVKSPSVAEAARHLGLRNCRSLGGRSHGGFAVAATSFAASPCIPFSLCNLIECMVRRNQAGTARDGPFGSRAYYYVLPPTDSLGPKPTEIPRLVVFTATALFVWSLSAAQRGATESLRRARDELKVTVQELQNANETLQTESRERKSAEESLRRSESYLAEAQRLSHTGSWASIPATGEIRYMSEECYRVLGFDPHGGQPRYAEFFERIHPDDQAKVREAVETAGRENTEFELDYRIIHPHGEIRDIHVVGHPVFSSTGALVEYVGTVIDITERKRAEERTRLIIDTVPAQLWTESPDGVVDFVNRRWVDYTGMTLEQAVGSGWNRRCIPMTLSEC